MWISFLSRVGRCGYSDVLGIFGCIFESSVLQGLSTVRVRHWSSSGLIGLGIFYVRVRWCSEWRSAGACFGFCKNYNYKFLGVTGTAHDTEKKCRHDLCWVKLGCEVLPGICQLRNEWCEVGAIYVWGNNFFWRSSFRLEHRQLGLSTSTTTKS